jgi:hypothetical protein
MPQFLYGYLQGSYRTLVYTPEERAMVGFSKLIHLGKFFPEGNLV